LPSPGIHFNQSAKLIIRITKVFFVFILSPVCFSPFDNSGQNWLQKSKLSYLIKAIFRMALWPDDVRKIQRYIPLATIRPDLSVPFHSTFKQPASR
jgi:hypothetical protein